MHQNAEMLFKANAGPHVQSCTRVLEVGGVFYKEYIRSLRKSAFEFDNCDVTNHPQCNVQMKGPYSICARDDCYNLVVTGQVIEHVQKIWEWVPELARVLSRGGKMIITAPVSWPRHSDMDCWRILPDGMNVLFKLANLEPLLIVMDSLDGKATDTIGIAIKP